MPLGVHPAKEKWEYKYVLNISKFMSTVALNWLPWVNRKEVIAQASPRIVQMHWGPEAHASVPLLLWHNLQIVYFVLPLTILPCSHTFSCSVNRHNLLWILKNSKTESQAMYQVLLMFKKCIKNLKKRKKKVGAWLFQWEILFWRFVLCFS